MVQVRVQVDARHVARVVDAALVTLEEEMAAVVVLRVRPLEPRHDQVGVLIRLGLGGLDVVCLGLYVTRLGQRRPVAVEAVVGNGHRRVWSLGAQHVVAHDGGRILDLDVALGDDGLQELGRELGQRRQPGCCGPRGVHWLSGEGSRCWQGPSRRAPRCARTPTTAAARVARLRRAFMWRSSPRIVTRVSDRVAAQARSTPPSSGYENMNPSRVDASALAPGVTSMDSPRSGEDVT